MDGSWGTVKWNKVGKESSIKDRGIVMLAHNLFLWVFLCFLALIFHMLYGMYSSFYFYPVFRYLSYHSCHLPLHAFEKKKVCVCVEEEERVGLWVGAHTYVCVHQCKCVWAMLHPHLVQGLTNFTVRRLFYQPYLLEHYTPKTFCNI